MIRDASARSPHHPHPQVTTTTWLGMIRDVRTSSIRMTSPTGHNHNMARHDQRRQRPIPPPSSPSSHNHNMARHDPRRPDLVDPDDLAYGSQPQHGSA